MMGTQHIKLKFTIERLSIQRMSFMDSIMYFTNYTLIVQVHTHVNDLCTQYNYSDDMLFYLLDTRHYLNICERLTSLLEDKSLLNQYWHIYHIKWFELLISFYPHVDIRYLNDQPLVLACIHGYDEVVKFIVENGGNVRVYNYYPFQCACSGGYVNIVKYLLESLDDDVERMKCVMSDDKYAIKEAIENSHVEVIKYLIENYNLDIIEMSH